MQHAQTLYFSLHIDAADGEAAFLIEAYSIIILRVNTQLHIGAAEGSCLI